MRYGLIPARLLRLSVSSQRIGDILRGRFHFRVADRHSIMAARGQSVQTHRVECALKASRVETEEGRNQPELLTNRRGINEVLGAGFLRRRRIRSETALEHLESVKRIGRLRLRPISQ